MTVVNITSGTTWTVPSDWNSANNTIDTYGAGGGGGGGRNSNSGAGGGGGAYSIISNLTLSPSATVGIGIGAAGSAGASSGGAGGVGGDTWLCNANSNCANISGTAVQVGAKGGTGPTLNSTVGGAGGVGTSGVGTTRRSGGTGGASSAVDPGAGGGGAAGSTGVGGTGATSAAGGAGGAAGGGQAGAGGAGGNAANGAAGSNYGGAGGGGGLANANLGGAGAPGIIVATYTASGALTNKTVTVTSAQATSAVRQTGKIVPRITSAQAEIVIRSVVKIATISIGEVASLVRAVGKIAALAITEAITVVTPRTRVRVNSIAQGSNVSLITSLAFLRVFAISWPEAVTVPRAPGKIHSISSGQSVVIRRSLGTTIAAVLQGIITTLKNSVGTSVSIATSSLLTLIPTKAIRQVSTIAWPQAVTLARSIGKIIARVSSAQSIVIRRAATETINIVQSQGESFRLRIGHTATPLLGQLVQLTPINAYRRIITVLFPQLVTESGIKLAVKTLAVSSPEKVTMVRSSGKIAAVSQSLLITLRRSLGSHITILNGTIVSLVNSVARTVAIAQSQLITLRRAAARIVSIVAAQAVTVRRSSARTISFGLPQLLTAFPDAVRSRPITITQGQSLSLLRPIGKIILIGIAQAISIVRRRLRDPGTTEPAVVRSGNNVFLVTVTGHDGSTVQTLRFSSEGVMTKPSDTPASTYFEPRVIDPGNFERHLFSSGTTRGSSSVGEGDVVLATSVPGRKGSTLDYLLGWAFDGYSILIQSLTTVRQSVSLAKTLFSGTIEQLITTDAYNKISFKIHDKLADLNQPLLTNTFGGTTTAGGLGTADGNSDLTGAKKQKCFGVNFNVTAQVANAFDLVYLFSDSAVASIVAYDGGVALTNDGDVANLAALLAWVQVAGHYKTCLAIGSIRLGATPTYGLTADVTEGALVADHTAAQIAKRIMTAFGIAGGSIDSTSVTALDAKNAAECGIVVTAETTALSAATQVLDSIGGYLLPNRSGVYQVGRFEAPSGSPVVGLDESTIIGSSLQRITTGDDGRGIPTWRVRLNYGLNNTPQNDTQLAGSVSQGRRTFLNNQWRASTPAQDTSVQTIHKYAVDVKLDTCLVFVADANAEATRLLNLHKVRRDAYRVRAMLDYADAADLGSVVSLMVKRFGLDAGQSFVVFGRVDDYQRKQIELDLWG